MSCEELEKLTNMELVEAERDAMHKQNYALIEDIRFEMAHRFKWYVDDNILPGGEKMVDLLPKF